MGILKFECDGVERDGLGKGDGKFVLLGGRYGLGVVEGEMMGEDIMEDVD